jgi:hypothetical protein
VDPLIRAILLIRPAEAELAMERVDLRQSVGCAWTVPGGAPGADAVCGVGWVRVRVPCRVARVGAGSGAGRARPGRRSPRGARRNGDRAQVWSIAPWFPPPTAGSCPLGTVCQTA